MKRLFTLACASLLAAIFLPAVQAAVPKPVTLKVTTLAGKSFDLSAQRGKWVIVNFWATWCIPCVHEMPALSKFVKDHGNVTAIGLAYQDADPADLKAFLAKHPISYPVSQVDTLHPPAAFGAQLGLPTTYLIAPDGTLAHKFVGPVTPAELSKAIGKGG